ncbi:hypothetical protein P691DRAFT_232291 [Macrolepiota fuliginosa MF-IS2]|uniref:Uncharacterized protein n=1 Tax=Macrolepiota fuliginosa MF-IS2 TaxID=1400762 RepID=A0A9P5X6Z1_9AGAR|nr:hypothetical protein P691DRAFT_232291 [Macrolepiota fuliginosa MF-IS2]
MVISALTDGLLVSSSGYFLFLSLIGVLAGSRYGVASCFTDGFVIVYWQQSMDASSGYSQRSFWA